MLYDSSFTFIEGVRCQAAIAGALNLPNLPGTERQMIQAAKAELFTWSLSATHEVLEVCMRLSEFLGDDVTPGKLSMVSLTAAADAGGIAPEALTMGLRLLGCTHGAPLGQREVPVDLFS